MINADVVPSLRDLCLRLISDSILNLDNAIFVLDFSKTHYLDALERRAETFVRHSFSALRQRHTREELESALGSEAYAALEAEQVALDAQVARNKQVGGVIDPEAWTTEGKVGSTRGKQGPLHTTNFVFEL